MTKKRRTVSLLIFIAVIAVLLAGIFLIPGAEHNESVKEVMRDAVLHEHDHIALIPGVTVNPGLLSAFVVSAVLILFALCVRIFAIPRFKIEHPGRFQYLLERGVGLFTNLAKQNSPHRSGFIGAYIFTAGVYIFFGTLFELTGVQAVTEAGHSVALPAPLSDINGAIGMGLFSYGVILFGGLVCNGFRGMFNALKDFSLPISMSFRLFGALLSGALVTELVYYYTATSFVIPVAVGVLFTVLHAVIQAYVLTMLVSIFFGESTEKKSKEKKVTES